jgi:hypothetical protein
MGINYMKLPELEKYFYQQTISFFTYPFLVHVVPAACTPRSLVGSISMRQVDSRAQWRDSSGQLER